jgi:hypothetical protein
LKLINQSEHHLVRGRVQQTAEAAGADPSKAAHSIGRHLLKGAPGARGLGVPAEEFRDRFLDAPGAVNSGWAGKGEMALLLSELLNSDIGQFALGALDRGANRIAVHYLNAGKLAALTGHVKMNESRVTVVPAQEVITMKDIFNKKTGALIKSIPAKQTIPGSKSAKVLAKDVAVVNAVLDRHGQGLHLQTLFPSSEAAESYADWRIGGVEIRAAFVHGKVVERVTPAT